MSPSRSIARWSARLEAHLSTHAFTHIFLVFYAAVVALMFTWGAVGEWRHQIAEGTPTQFRWFIAIARGAGYTLNLNTAFVILLAARLFFTWLRDTPLNLILPLDKAFPAIHIITGYTIVVAVLVHAAFHMAWVAKFQGWQGGLWGITMSVATGFCLFLVLFLMLIFAQPKIRKNYFRLFYIVHLVGALLFFVLLIFHGMYRNRPETYKYITPPLIIYLIDRLIRRFKISSTTLELSTDNLVFQDDNVLELRIPKPFGYKSGQYAEIMVPSINKEWHPFTIASASHEDSMKFFIKNLGDWTAALHEAFQKRLDASISESLPVRVRGPFGAPAQHVAGYERVVLISGGIGSTPFSAICKDLHHLNKINDDDTIHMPRDNLSLAEARVDNAISKRYDVNVSTSAPASETAQQRSVYVSDMLRMTATSLHHRLSQRSNMGTHQPGQAPAARDPEFDAVMVDDDDNLSFVSSTAPSTAASCITAEENGSSGVCRVMDTRTSTKKHLQTTPTEKRMRRRLSLGRLFDKRALLLAFLHSTRVSFFLLVTLIARIAVLCVGSILKSSYISMHEEVGDTVGRWVVTADVSLSLLFVIILPLTILLEISFLGSKFFHTWRRCVDFLAFIPLTIAYSALSLNTVLRNQPAGETVVLLQYVVFIPVLFILLAIRMYRSIGSRNQLSEGECRCSMHAKVPEVDFVWTTPHDGDDEWLRRELEPLAGGTDLRLHRYVTRGKDIDLESGDDHITTRTGRPNWDEVFAEVGRVAKSGSSVGVFFCGPHVMGDAVRQAMHSVEIASNLRGAYLNGTDANSLAEDIGVEKEQLRRLKEVGCSVRFVFREENFG